MVAGPGSMEAAGTEPAGAVDGGQLHLPLSHHDGRYDGHDARAGHLHLQAGYQVEGPGDKGEVPGNQVGGAR